MKIQKLTLKNFRGISSLAFDFDPQMNVIVGVNGAGKSSILDCAAILLSRLTSAISSPSSGGRLYQEEDIKNGAAFTNNTIQVAFDADSMQWNMARTRGGHPQEIKSDLGGLKQISDKVQARFAADKKAPVPLAVLYPVNRAVLDIPSRIREHHDFNQIDAYYGALTGAQNNFRLFFEWFRDREDIENETYSRLLTETPSMNTEVVINRRQLVKDRELEAVRTAIPKFLPGFGNLHIQRSPHRMVLEKNKEELIVNQLSDGEKCTLALVGDLARRLAMANPDLKNPLEAAGVVLIDEIDLHMHPGWQRRVVPALSEAFPNCQFILTTHSPQVVSEVKANKIWVLDAKGTRTEHPNGAFGLDSNRILEDMMDVPERPKEIKDKIARLFELIDAGKLQESMTRMEDLRTEIGSDPELTKAAILIRRKETLGK